MLRSARVPLDFAYISHTYKEGLLHCVIYSWEFTSLNHPNFCDYSIQTGHTALHVAAQEGHLRVVETLLEANSDMNIYSKVSYSLYHISSCNCYI